MRPLLLKNYLKSKKKKNEHGAGHHFAHEPPYKFKLTGAYVVILIN